jgi:hypothetical protein
MLGALGVIIVKMGKISDQSISQEVIVMAKRNASLPVGAPRKNKRKQSGIKNDVLHATTGRLPNDPIGKSDTNRQKRPTAAERIATVFIHWSVLFIRRYRATPKGITSR